MFSTLRATLDLAKGTKLHGIVCGSLLFPRDDAGVRVSSKFLSSVVVVVVVVVSVFI